MKKNKERILMLEHEVATLSNEVAELQGFVANLVVRKTRVDQTDLAFVDRIAGRKIRARRARAKTNAQHRFDYARPNGFAESLAGALTEFSSSSLV